MQVQNALRNNDASIFGLWLQRPMYAAEVANKKEIYIPTDEAMEYVLSVTNLSLEQFQESDEFDTIIYYHIRDYNKFRLATDSKGNKTIDDITILKTIKIGKTNINFIHGLIVLKIQRDGLRELGKLLAKCPTTVCPEVTPCLSDHEQLDQFSYDMFKIWDLKYTKADKVFERASNKILTLYQQKLLLDADRDTLGNILNIYSEAYTRFVSQVAFERTFTPKAGSGQLPINIVTAKDWAEATIELVDLVNKFNQTLNESISIFTKPDYLKRNCKVKKINDCNYPCNKISGYITESCSY